MVSKHPLKKNEKDQIILEQFLKTYLKNASLSVQEVEKILIQNTRIITIPISIFNAQLGISQSIVKYLKENKNLTFATIAKILHKDQRTVWSTYHQASKKYSSAFVIKSQDLLIPLDNFNNEKYSDIESVIIFLKEKYHLTYTQIAKVLSRDLRNIWAIYNKAKKKDVKK